MHLLIIILTILFISIPEESFIVLLAVRLTGRYDLLNTKLGRIKLSIPIFFGSVTSTLLRQKDLDQMVNFLLASSLIYVLLVIITKKDTLKISIFFVVTLIIFIVTELIYVALLQKFIDLDPKYFTNNFIDSLLYSSIERVIDSIILVLLYKNKVGNSKDLGQVKVRVRNVLNNVPFIRNLYIAIVLMCFGITCAAYKFIAFDKILIKYNISIQLLVIGFFVIFPFAVVAGVTLIIHKMSYHQKFYEVNIIGNINKLSKELVEALQENDIAKAKGKAVELKSRTNLHYSEEE